MLYQIFDTYATEYDAWYDAGVGEAIFATEVDCLKPLLKKPNGPCLEVGVGSGRFAQALGIAYGVDPAPAPLQMAKARGIQAIEALGEELPFPDRMFGCVLIALTLCFVNDPRRVLQEVWRVLQPKGGFVLGLILRNGPWGEFYADKGNKRHPMYGKARFFSKDEVDSLLQLTGFKVLDYCSTLFQPPGQYAYRVESSVSGYQQSAGFVAIGIQKQEDSL